MKKDANVTLTTLLIACVISLLVMTMGLLFVREADAETVNLLERSVALEQELRFEVLRLFLWAAANEVGHLDHYYAVTNDIMSHEKTWNDAADQMAMYFVNVQWAQGAVSEWASSYGLPEVQQQVTGVISGAELYANSKI